MNSSVVLDKDKFSVANSTSYVDFLGLYAGLSRFPGETSDQFADRIQRAVNLNLSSNYEGLLNQINLRLGLQPVELMQVNDSTGKFILSVDVQGLVLTNTLESVRIPTRTVDSDGFWQWRRISQVIHDINATRTFTASSDALDVPAVQMVWQSNAKQITQIPVSGDSFMFPEGGAGVEPETVLFNFSVPNYVFTEQNRGVIPWTICADAHSEVRGRPF